MRNPPRHRALHYCAPIVIQRVKYTSRPRRCPDASLITLVENCTLACYLALLQRWAFHLFPLISFLLHFSDSDYLTGEEFRSISCFFQSFSSSTLKTQWPLLEFRMLEMFSKERNMAAAHCGGRISFAVTTAQGCFSDSGRKTFRLSRKTFWVCLAAANYFTFVDSFQNKLKFVSHN